MRKSKRIGGERMKGENVATEAAVLADVDSEAVVDGKKKRHINRAKLQENLWGWLFVSLLVIGTTIFVYIAFAITIVLSFTNYRGEALFDYLGNLTTRDGDALYWYKFMFSHYDPLKVMSGDSTNFWSTLGNAFFYLLGIPVGMILSIILAVCMSRDIKCTNAFRVIYYIPTVASVVSISLIWKRLFDTNGVINEMLGTKIEWLGVGGGAALRKVTILFMTVWKGLGGSVILFVAGLNGVNASYHEAADIDGANAWQIFWRITMPQIYPTIFYVLVTSVIGGMQIYVEPELVYGSFGEAGVGTSVTPFVGYIMYRTNTSGWYGYGCALSVILALIIFILTLIQFGFDSRRDKA